MRRAAAALAAALVLTGCGTPAADLFIVERAGSIPGARLTLRVGDGGTVRCDGGPEREIASEDLLDARQIAEELRPHLDRGTSLPARSGSVLQYRVLGEEGEARFADNSVDQPQVFAQVVVLTRKLARSACGRDR